MDWSVLYPAPCGGCVQKFGEAPPHYSLLFPRGAPEHAFATFEHFRQKKIRTRSSSILCKANSERMKLEKSVFVPLVFGYQYQQQQQTQLPQQQDSQAG
jgi:hypothetical protein